MNFTAVVEHCKETGIYVGYVPGFTELCSFLVYELSSEVVHPVL